MRCPECEHENTEGAWLCINCGSKLPRPEDDAPEIKMADQPQAPDAQQEDPSRFAPQISENLRRLRDRTEREREQKRSTQRIGTPSGVILGLPLTVWALVAFIFVIFVYVLSALQ
ncbi:MAG: hypothetical protein CL790_04760 [Chloroflexi bacterium]|nr:hypothetical protein [Chloroflexota bacterium]HCU72253.1 hypothetical protein [Chloroflexota bacterium]